MLIVTYKGCCATLYDILNKIPKNLAFITGRNAEDLDKMKFQEALLYLEERGWVNTGGGPGDFDVPYLTLYFKRMIRE